MTYAAIFRVDSVGGNESNSPKIEFDPTSQSHCTRLVVNNRNRDSNLTSPYSNDIERPYVGIEGSVIELDLLFDERLSTADNIQKLFDWYYDGDDTPEDMPKGRFGLRYDLRPELDCRPSATAGYKILSFALTQGANVKTVTTAKLTLAFDGDYASRETS